MIGVTILNGPPLYIWDGSAGQDRLFEKFSANREREKERVHRWIIHSAMNGGQASPCARRKTDKKRAVQKETARACAGVLGLGAFGG